MLFLVLVAILLAPVAAVLAVLAFFLVRIDCYGGVRIMGFRIGRGPRKWTLVPQGPVDAAAVDWRILH